MQFQIVKVPDPLDPNNRTIVLDFEGQGIWRVYHCVTGTGENARIDIYFYDRVIFTTPPFRSLNLVFVFDVED